MRRFKNDSLWLMSVMLVGESSKPTPDSWFWLEVEEELLLLLLFAMSDTMEVGEVVSEEMVDEFDAEDEDAEQPVELPPELMEVRMVDEVTEVGGVLDADSNEPVDGGEPARCALSWGPWWV